MAKRADKPEYPVHPERPEDTECPECSGRREPRLSYEQIVDNLRVIRNFAIICASGSGYFVTVTVSPDPYVTGRCDDYNW